MEKALKALLTNLGLVAPRTHDLLMLLDALQVVPPELESYREALGVMTAYAVEMRYPADWYEPPREEAQKALKTAEIFVKRVVHMLDSLGQH